MVSEPNIYYAIGDVHGEVELLQALHREIDAYHCHVFPDRFQTIVHLGDYIDRGSDSYAVIEYLSTLKQRNLRDTQVINLKGNHEAMICNVYDRITSKTFGQWIENGGRETLASYNKRGYEQPPETHLVWMKALPSFFFPANDRLAFVHAGFNTATFPNDNEDYHLWTRSPKFFDTRSWCAPALDDVTVVHGHTPTSNNRPFISEDGRRINVDTGACYGGFLSAAVLENGEFIDYISV